MRSATTGLLWHWATLPRRGGALRLTLTTHHALSFGSSYPHSISRSHIHAYTGMLAHWAHPRSLRRGLPDRPLRRSLKHTPRRSGPSTLTPSSVAAPLRLTRAAPSGQRALDCASTHRVAVAIHAHSLDPSGSQSLAQVRYQHGYARARGEHEALGRVSAASEEGALGEQLLGERGCCALSLEDSTRVNT